MGKQYQVVGPLGQFTTMSPTGKARLYFYRGAMVPQDAPQPEIDHHLSVGLIAEVGDDPYRTPVDGNGVDTPVGEPTGGDERSSGDGDSGHQDDSKDDANSDVEAKRAAARAKLPADGSAPAGNASHEVWVEYAVAKGYDRAEVEKSSRDDLKALFKN